MDDTVESWVQLLACGACGRMMGWGVLEILEEEQRKAF